MVSSYTNLNVVSSLTLLVMSACGPDISNSSGIGYNSNTPYSPTMFTPQCDAGCPTLETPQPSPQPNPTPSPNPTPNPTLDASSIDAIIDAIPIDASWEGLCTAYGYAGSNGPICRRKNANNEIDEGGIVGCDSTGAACCIDPDQNYSSIDPAPCTAGNWAPGFPRSVPESDAGKCVRTHYRESTNCQAYLIDTTTSPSTITSVDGGQTSCDDLGNPCCYVANPQLPLSNRWPGCLDPSQVTFFDDTSFNTDQ